MRIKFLFGCLSIVLGLLTIAIFMRYIVWMIFKK